MYIKWHTCVGIWMSVLVHACAASVRVAGSYSFNVYMGARHVASLETIEF